MEQTSPPAKWYIADLVVEIQVEGDHRNVVHTNTFLIRAISPEEAYEKANQLGADQEITYHNPAGKLVTFKFRGLHNLNATIDDELDHGSELAYGERIGMDEVAISNCLCAKEELSVFAPRTFRQSDPTSGPDYSSGEIMEKLYDEFPHLRATPPEGKPN